MFRKSLYVTLALIMLPFTVQADLLFPFPGANDIQAWNKGLNAADIGVHKSDEEMWTESWYFQTRLPDGRYLFNHFVISNAGWGSFMGAVESTVLSEDGSVEFEKEKIDSDDMSYDNAKGEVLFGKNHYLKGKPGFFEVSVNGSRIQYKFTVKNRAPGLKPGDGKVWFVDSNKRKKYDPKEDTYYDLGILTPNGVISGNLVVNGKASTIAGTVYGDHSHQTFPAHKMTDRLFSMRGFSDSTAVDALVFVPPEEYGANTRIASLVFAEGNRNLFAARNLISEELDLKEDPEKTSYKLPGRIKLKNVEGEPVFEGEIKLKKQIQRQDAVKDFSFVERTLIKMFVARPVLYRYNASYNFSFSLPGTSETRKVSGEALVEYMILRDKR